MLLPSPLTQPEDAQEEVEDFKILEKENIHLGARRLYDVGYIFDLLMYDLLHSF